MKRCRSARIARPNGDRAASANSPSPGKMARIAATIKQKEPTQPVCPLMTNYHQLSPILTSRPAAQAPGTVDGPKFLHHFRTVPASLFGRSFSPRSLHQPIKPNPAQSDPIQPNKQKQRGAWLSWCYEQATTVQNIATFCLICAEIPHAAHRGQRQLSVARLVRKRKRYA